ncbi:MAG: hypothetical protein A2X46_12365 [Lentisphaerae bacterium GWF2_57_35]|nr:MAG: hypothetical protein A2X46_12365 [Lentisphaerae bacterium GWF2_57_35]
MSVTLEWENTFDAVPDLIAIIDCDFRIVRVNKAMADRLGRTPQELVGKPCHACVHQLDHSPLTCPYAELLRTGQSSCTVEIHEESLGADFLVTVSPLYDAQGALTGVVHVARDITDRKRAEDSLRASEERYRLITENSHDLISLVRADDMTYVYRNEVGIRALGYSLKELVGKSPFELIHPDDQKRAREDLKVVLNQGEVATEIRYKRKDGAYIWFEVRGRLLKGPSGESLILLASRDVTERKHRQILEVKEREQRRIGQDLHDGLCQQLTGISMLSSLLEKQLLTAGQTQLAKKAAEIVGFLAESVSQAHSLARGLLPVPSDPSGLHMALEELADTLSRMFRIECRYEYPKPAVVADPQVSMHLYRIAQEAAGNAIRHGKAKKIRIKLKQTGKVVELIVTDNGKGIQNELHAGEGLGLHIMEYRARQIGASFDIRNHGAGGVRVTCRLSCAPVKPVHRASRLNKA